jgi:hypothetical protein
MAVLSDDYFRVEPDEIRGLESVLTLLGGEVVYGAAEYSPLCPELPPVSPDWSPVAMAETRGYNNSAPSPRCVRAIL